MKLYYVPKAPVGHRWQGTQADAKQTGKTFASEFAQREVPVDKPNLLQFLNAEEAVTLQQAPPAEQQLDDLERAELAAVRAVRGTTEASEAAAVKVTAGAVIDFLFDHATNADIDSIMTALGSRVSNIVRGAASGT